MTRLRGIFCIGLLALAPLMLLQPRAMAEPVHVYTDYSVSLIGLPVAYLKFKTEIDGASYKISGNLRTSALTNIVSKSRGNASVSGKFGKDRLRASRFSVAYTADAKTHKTEIRFNNGNVSSATNTPKRKRTAADWVPISAEDMREVLDPLSGLVFPASARVCPSSLPIFDGETRVTLHLKPKGVRPFRTKGFKGDAIVCAIRFVPQAGYRKGSSAIRYLQKLTKMEVWFAKHEQGGFYAPVYAKVPTKIGQVVVAATRFGG